MVVPILKGGLGNQMFQIACAYAHAKRHGTEFGINYNIPHVGGQGKPHIKYKNTIFKNIPETDFVPQITYSERGFAYQEIPKPATTLLLDGYWQSEKYFEEFGDEISELFYFSEEDKEKWNQIKERIPLDSIIGYHVRRGDYVHYEHTHPCLGKSYYDSAVGYFERNNTTVDVVYNVIICCDDWYSLMEENMFTELPFIKYHSTQGSTELQDLYILSQCPKLVMSNSTFSWWGAFLGRKHNMVITPKRWFGPKGPQDYKDIYNPFWFKL